MPPWGVSTPPILFRSSGETVLAGSVMTVKHSGVLEHRERRLFYLERLSDSPTVTVFLHGLGLDASDYRDYLERDTEHHQIALTLKGFDPVEERPDRPVSLAE